MIIILISGTERNLTFRSHTPQPKPSCSLDPSGIAVRQERPQAPAVPGSPGSRDLGGRSDGCSRTREGQDGHTAYISHGTKAVVAI